MANRVIFQYLVRVEPILTPQLTGGAAASDTVILTQVTLLQYQATTFVSPSVYPVVLDWLRQGADPPRSLARPQSEGVLAPFQPAAVTTFLDWDVQAPTPGPLPPRPVGWVAVAPFQPGTEVTRLDWLQEAPIAPRLLPRPSTEGTLAPFQPPVAPTTFLDWQVEGPTPPTPPSHADRQLAWAAPLWVPDVTTPAPILSWQGYQPAQIWPRVRPFPPAAQQALAASPTMFQSIPPAAVIAGQISVDYPEMPTNMSGGVMLGGFQ